MRSLKHRTVHALCWSFVGTGGKVLAQFFIQIWLARTLGPGPYGAFAAMLILVSIGVLLAESGFGSSLVQRKTLTDADIEHATGLVLTTSTALSLLILLNAQTLVSLFGFPAGGGSLDIVLCAVLVPVLALSNISLALLRRNLRQQAIAALQLASYVVGFGGVGVLAAMAGWGATALLIAHLTQAVLTLVGGYAMTRHPLRMRLSGDRSLMRFGLQVVMTNVVNWLIENCDKYLIGRYWGTPELGAYTVATNLARTPCGILLGAIQPVAFSSASRVQDEVTRLKEGYLDLLNLTSLVVFPLFALLHVNAHSIITHLYGDAWATAIPLFAVMCVAIPTYALLAVTGPILWATDHVRKELHSQIVVAVLMAAALLLLRDYPLTEVIWVIPALYLLRFVMVCRALAITFGLGLSALVVSLRGGLVLAVVAAGTNHLGTSLPGLQGSTALVTSMVPPLLATVLTLLTGWLFARHLVQHRLRAVLAARWPKRAAVAA